MNRETKISCKTFKPPKVLAIIGQGDDGLQLAMAAVDAGWSEIGIHNITNKLAQPKPLPRQRKNERWRSNEFAYNPRA